MAWFFVLNSEWLSKDGGCGRQLSLRIRCGYKGYVADLLGKVILDLKNLSNDVPDITMGELRFVVCFCCWK